MKAIFKKIFENRHSTKTLVYIFLIGILLVAITTPMVFSIAKYGISNANVKYYEDLAEDVAGRNGDRTALDMEIKRLKAEQEVMAEFDSIFGWCLSNKGNSFLKVMRDLQILIIAVLASTGLVLISASVYGVFSNTMHNEKLKEEDIEVISPFVEDWSTMVRMEKVEPSQSELLRNLLKARDACNGYPKN